MAKTAKLKKAQSSLHSRAARRAASPILPTTSSTHPPKPRDSSLAAPHILAAHSSGVTKKSKHTRMTRAQRTRHLQALSRAEENMDKLAVKRGKSLVRGKLGRERGRGWDDVNGVGLSGRKKEMNNGEGDAEGEERGKEIRGWGEDEDMGGAEDGQRNGGEVLNEEIEAEGKVLEAVVPTSIPLSAVEDEELL